MWGGLAEGTVELGVLFKDQRKDWSCWGVMIKEGGSVRLRGDWAMQSSVHRDPARELKGEISFVKLFSLLRVPRLPSGKVKLVAGMPLRECWEGAKEKGFLGAVRGAGME